MAFAEGRAKTGGRKSGTPNRATYSARHAISIFVEDNADKLQQWLDEIHEKEGALAAFKCFTAILEYSVPKLTRENIVIETPREALNLTKPMSAEEAMELYQKALRQSAL
jgi:hypothetical protein